MVFFEKGKLLLVTIGGQLCATIDLDLQSPGKKIRKI